MDGWLQLHSGTSPNVTVGCWRTAWREAHEQLWRQPYMSSDVLLRELTADGLPIFFAHQLDSEASHMAAFTETSAGSAVP